MVDDIGFECLSINGSKSYKTPVLDSLASPVRKANLAFVKCNGHISDLEI
jgi:hypothetical protein